MIYWKVEPHMDRCGIGTAYALAKRAEISQPGAHRVLSGAPVERIDTAMLLALAKAFGVKNPLTLLESRPD